MMIQAMVSSIITSSKMAEKLVKVAPGSNISKPTITPDNKDSIGLRLKIAMTMVTAAGISTNQLSCKDTGNLLVFQLGSYFGQLLWFRKFMQHLSCRPLINE
jgi:hypothetical protein